MPLAGTVQEILKNMLGHSLEVQLLDTQSFTEHYYSTGKSNNCFTATSIYSRIFLDGTLSLYTNLKKDDLYWQVVTYSLYFTFIYRRSICLFK